MNRRNLLKFVAAGALFGIAAQGNAAQTHTPRGRTFGTDLAPLRGGETRPTLSPAKFTGKTADAYRAAREIPNVLDHLYCYCECEVSGAGHKSLKSCYVDQHAVYCGICQDEAIMALKLSRKGHSIIEIRRAIDAAFFRA